MWGWQMTLVRKDTDVSEHERLSIIKLNIYVKNIIVNYLSVHVS